MSTASATTTRDGQLSFQDGLTRKARGQARVTSNTDAEWAAAVDATILRWANTGQPFTAEDVRFLAAYFADAGEPHHPNAWGARMSAAGRRGVIRKTGRYVQAGRAERHAAVIAEWIGTGT